MLDRRKARIICSWAALGERAIVLNGDIGEVLKQL